MRSSTYSTKTGRRSTGRRTSASGGWSNNRWNSSNSRWNSNSAGGSWTPTASYSPAQYSNIREELQQRASSYRTLYSECSGPGKVTGFSPTTAKSWVRFVNNGCYVYRWNNAEFCRTFGNKFGAFSNTIAFRTLRQRFGAGIKAVTRGKGNCWLIAATNSVTARPFSNYTWK
ncbi:MAG: hypothetical protein HRU75_08600 [Planctomycetia bacterium]|nr:MAG: hypothetical protein HRU75_08600 [Planctomycetia bacterium]